MSYIRKRFVNVTEDFVKAQASVAPNVVTDSMGKFRLSLKQGLKRCHKEVQRSYNCRLSFIRSA